MRLTVAAPLRFEAFLVRHHRVAGTAVVRTGMGRRRALAAAASLPVDGAVAIAGFGGGVDAALRAGQVLVATEVRAADGSLPPLALPGAAVLAAAFRRAGLDAVTGPLVSSARLVRGDARSVLAAGGARVVDMESAWFLGELVRRGMDPRRLAALRVVADTATHHLVSPATVTGGVQAARVLHTIGPVLERWAAAQAPRHVLAAGPRSFCAGVERAITVVERALERYGAPVFVRRQIVHNTHVVRRLEGLGAVFVREVDDVPAGSTVVLAAHGVTPDVRRDADDRGLFVIDATCPLVAKVHHEARRHHDDGHHIVLIGHSDHEEVIGTLGEAPGRISVVEHPDDVDHLDIADDEPVAYLTQTTLALDETAEVIAALHARYPAIIGPRADDICYATQNRQEAVRAIAPECDLVVVVGSANSSNTNRLAEVARRAGCPAVLVEDAGELDLERLAGARTIGVTAGASAPESLVEGVVAALDVLGPVTVEERRVVDETIQFRLPAEVR